LVLYSLSPQDVEQVDDQKKQRLADISSFAAPNIANDNQAVPDDAAFGFFRRNG
jgi:hypothetical protein